MFHINLGGKTQIAKPLWTNEIPAPVDRCGLSHYSPLVHPNWCRMCSTDSTPKCASWGTSPLPQCSCRGLGVVENIIDLGSVVLIFRSLPLTSASQILHGLKLHGTRYSGVEIIFKLTSGREISPHASRHQQVGQPKGLSKRSTFTAAKAASPASGGSPENNLANRAHQTTNTAPAETLNFHESMGKPGRGSARHSATQPLSHSATQPLKPEWLSG